MAALVWGACRVYIGHARPGNWACQSFLQRPPNPTYEQSGGLRSASVRPYAVKLPEREHKKKIRRAQEIDMTKTAQLTLATVANYGAAFGAATPSPLRAS